ncbi:MAG: hypothetical protein ABIO35_10915 [Nitrobacter sp.]
MSFVKDDYAHTRGVGAVAALDAASPRRRRAMAQVALKMARRDRLMAIGAVNFGAGVGPRSGSMSPGRIVNPNDVGVGGGGGRGRKPVVDIKIITPGRGVSATRTNRGLVFVDPAPPTGGPLAWTGGRDRGALPPRETKGSSGGGSSGGGSSGGGAGIATPPPPVDASVVDELISPPETTGSDSRTLMYAAIGIGALLLFGK